jgi:TldD protein
MLLFALAGVLACGGSGDKRRIEHPKTPDDGPALDLPKVPATVATERTEPTSGDDPAQRGAILAALSEENQRWASALAQKTDFPAYFVGHQLLERELSVLEAEAGSLLRDDSEAGRLIDVEVRVGSRKLDSRHPMPNDPLQFLDQVQREARVPLGKDEKAIRHQLWLETDRSYREAVRRYKDVVTARSVESQGKKPLPELTQEEPATFAQPAAILEVDKAAWAERVKSCSRRSSRGVATRSTCRADFAATTTYYVNSEGSRIKQSWTEARFTVQVGVKADDGMSLGRVETRYAATPDALPSEAEVDAMIRAVNDDLDALHGAPIWAPFTGPSILQDRAAAVFFHEVFGHRIEGHRQKDETSGQTFSTKLGQLIMPAWISVYDDPTLRTLNGTYLNGFYRFDDEGVPAQRAELVQQGVLTGFVLGRTPIEGFSRSNGHGRREPGLWAVSRQGNLVVEAARSVPDDQLKALLIAEVKRQGKPYGMKFTDISGGFTNTSRFLPQSFKVNPIMAYRIYPDGREELVRGVDIEGTPLIALGSIMAAGREVEVFNGMCGAESGWVPVSASAPSLLLRQLEVARSGPPSGGSPTLPPPSLEKR